MRRTAGILLLAATLGSLSADAQTEGPNLLENGTFDDDVSGWTYDGSASGDLSWDAALGFPTPGSLRVESTDGVSGTFRAVGQCYELGGTSLFATLSARVRQENANCFIATRAYRAPACQDFFGEFQTEQPFDPAEWKSYTVPALGPASCIENPEFPCRQSIRPVLKASSGTGACNFDSVELRITSIDSIPVTGLGGILALAAGLGATALVLLSTRLR